ncbi:hypothetical protein [Leptothermofonsia sichuanensis]|uniref:hypothetical protein n=1 Tax=Leptothermofonsia sichuanensis TaxID=2917832 RepID=UPI001EF06670
MISDRVPASSPENLLQPGSKLIQRRYEKLNYQDPYLQTIFGFLGITDINFVHVENDELGGTGLVESIASAHAQINQLVSI